MVSPLNLTVKIISSLLICYASQAQPIRILDNVPASLIDSNNFYPEFYAANSLRVQTKEFAPDACEIGECGQQPGVRRLLSFVITIVNVSDTNWIGPTIYDRPELFEQDPCHDHLHLLHWTSFELYRNGKNVTTSGKLGWCIRSGTPHIIDAEPYLFRPKDCGVPYLAKGWGDTYGGVPCMWVDVTGLKDGEYTLVLRIDPLGIYGTPDALILPIRLTGDSVLVTDRVRGKGRFK